MLHRTVTTLVCIVVMLLACAAPPLLAEVDRVRFLGQPTFDDGEVFGYFVWQDGEEDQAALVVRLRQVAGTPSLHTQASLYSDARHFCSHNAVVSRLRSLFCSTLTANLTLL
jgi:hypothetical protein